MDRLLALLADGEFHSGQHLGQALGVSRASIWKMIARLEAETGLVVDRVRGNGYRLAAKLSLLDEDRIARAFAAHGWQVNFEQSVTSTNALALARLQQGAKAPFVILAEHQRAGRGRRGRGWTSPLGANLYFSYGFVTNDATRYLTGLSLVVGLAVVAALRGMGLVGAGLKWPNDVLVGRRKVAGVLIELSGDPGGECQVVIGVGVNVNMVEANIDQPWTSMKLESGHEADRSELAISLAGHLAAALELQRLQGFDAFRAEWEAHHLWQGENVTLRLGEREVSGKVLGIDGAGALLLSADGDVRSYSGGELSLRLAP